MSIAESDNLAAQFDRLPPNDVEAERNVLGSGMVDAQAFAAARATVVAEDFYVKDHEIIWRVMCEMVNGGDVVDPLTLMSALKKRGIWDELGGKEGLGRIIGAVVTTAHCEHYVKILKDHAISRGIIRIGNEAIRRAYAASKENSASDMAATLSSELAQLSLMATRSEPVSIGDAVWNVIEEKGNKQNIRRISTGMNALDELIGGLALSRFTIIGAKGGMGKSQLGKQIALNAATAGVKVGIITVEENQEKIAENLLSNASGIENHKIAFGNLHAEDWKQLVDNAAPKLASLPIWIDDTSFNISQIVASANKLASKYKCQIIMVDHIHLIDGQRHNATREREVAAISAALKTTFRKLDVAGVAMAQLNRAGEKGMRPDLTSLRDSGALEQDGDTIILLHREDYYHWKEQNFQADHMLEAIVTKNKDGRQGTALLNFDGATQSVKDWA